MGSRGWLAPSGSQPVVRSPIQLLVCTLAGWVNRGREDVIECLQEESRVLPEHPGRRRLLFADAGRRRLATKAERISRQMLSGIGPVVTPDTLLRWYRTLSGPMSGEAGRRAHVRLPEGGVRPVESWHHTGRTGCRSESCSGPHEALQQQVLEVPASVNHCQHIDPLRFRSINQPVGFDDQLPPGAQTE